MTFSLLFCLEPPAWQNPVYTFCHSQIRSFFVKHVCLVLYDLDRPPSLHGQTNQQAVYSFFAVLGFFEVVFVCLEGTYCLDIHTRIIVSIRPGSKQCVTQLVGHMELPPPFLPRAEIWTSALARSLARSRLFSFCLIFGTHFRNRL